MECPPAEWEEWITKDELAEALKQKSNNRAPPDYLIFDGYVF